jgi:hypothetical protein
LRCDKKHTKKHKKNIPGHLNLSHCDIDDEIMYALSDTLKTIPVVRHIDLRHNRITTHGAVALLKAIQQQFDSSEFTRASLCVECDELIQFRFPDKVNVMGCRCNPLSRGGTRYFLPAYWLDDIKIMDPVRKEQRSAQAKLDLRSDLMADLKYWIASTEVTAPSSSANGIGQESTTLASGSLHASSSATRPESVEPLLRTRDYDDEDLSRPTTTAAGQRASRSRASSSLTPSVHPEEPFTLSDVHDLISDVTEDAVTKLIADAKGILSDVAKSRMARSVFLSFDLDQSGHIDAKELRDALKSLGLKLSKKKVRTC